MTDTCRAAVFLGNATYEIREFAVPDPPPGGAVLQVEAVGLCGSDVAQFEGVEIVPGATAFPVVPGHETVGRVVKLAADAQLGVAEGDRVAVNEILMAPGALRLYGYSDMTGDGNVGLWGGYGEYMEIFPGTELHPMSDRLPAEELTLFEPLASAVHWVETVGVHERETVVVQGPGHQGLAVLEAVLAQRPRQVIVTGTSEDGLRLDAAKAIGASEVVMVDTVDAVQLVRDLTRGMGADVVFDVRDRDPDRAHGARPGAQRRAHPARRPQALRRGARHGDGPHRAQEPADLRRGRVHARVDGDGGGADRVRRGAHRRRGR